MNPERQQMVAQQIVARGIRDPLVIAAMASVPREAFVPIDEAQHAYQDRPLPIGEGQTISQPYVVALMAEALELCSRDRVLEVGAGSGYAAAVIASIAAEVYTIERRVSLAAAAQERLARLGFHNVQVRCGDGTLGWPEAAPFDGIVVAAGGPTVPDELAKQLVVGGRLVMPVGDYHAQKLLRVTRMDEHHFAREDLGSVQFVPLIGKRGWRGATAA